MTENSHDSEQQRLSLEQKRGGAMSDVRDQTWSFRRGDWLGVFGAHAAVVLPPSEKARVAGLWELVDDGAGFDEVLDALISSGLRDLPGFVLVSESDGETKVVIRGAARAHFTTPDEVVQVGGDGASTWVERTLSGVTRVRIEVADESDPGDLAIASGLVRLATAEFPAEPEVSAPEPGLTGDHDGTTRTGRIDPLQFERQQPGLSGQPQAPSVTARPVARLVFSSGETVDVDRAVLVGRAPEARRFTSTDQPRLVAVQSPHQEVSSTHLEVRPGSGADHGSAVATDLGSTNGTLIMQPGLPAEELKAGIAVQLIPGAVIDLGDGVTIQVVDA